MTATARIIGTSKKWPGKGSGSTASTVGFSLEAIEATGVAVGETAYPVGFNAISATRGDFDTDNYYDPDTGFLNTITAAQEGPYLLVINFVCQHNGTADAPSGYFDYGLIDITGRWPTKRISYATMIAGSSWSSLSTETYMAEGDTPALFWQNLLTVENMILDGGGRTRMTMLKLNP